MGLNVNDKKLTRGLVETIAGQWQRLGIETVEEAMTAAEKEHKKSNKKVIKAEVKSAKTPLWFDGKTAKVAYETTYGDGSTDKMKLDLILVDGEWKPTINK